MKWVFLYACVAFSCHGKPTIDGDGAYYDTKPLCQRAAVSYAKAHRIKLNRHEAICVEREP